MHNKYDGNMVRSLFLCHFYFAVFILSPHNSVGEDVFMGCLFTPFIRSFICSHRYCYHVIS